MKSLFVVSLPRSLSSHTYHRVRLALGLEQPGWTSDGEVLNPERHVLFPHGVSSEEGRFLGRRRDGERFERARSFLQQSANAVDFIYKDVVQPFIVTDWLPGSGLNILRIERDLADVVYAMSDRNWYYPAHAASEFEDPEDALIAGLLLAQRALATLPGPAIRFDDLIMKEDVLWEAMEKLYPDSKPIRESYIDSDFETARSEVLQRRTTDRYRKIAERCIGIAAAIKT